LRKKKNLLQQPFSKRAIGMSGRLEPFKQAQDYLPRLKAVFFGRWDEDKGCEITYQVPENSIRVTSTAPIGISPADSQQEPSNQYLFEFTDVIDFILPKVSSIYLHLYAFLLANTIRTLQKHLCGHLVTVSSGSVKILGFPTLIEDEEKYDRNFFMFNLCFVFDKDSELLGYEPIVRKTGRVLRSLEVSSDRKKKKKKRKLSLGIKKEHSRMFFLTFFFFFFLFSCRRRIHYSRLLIIRGSKSSRY
jgi:hypothetical protein